jgi:hypothetical protein
MKIGRGTRALGENLLQRYFVHHKSHMTRPGFESGPPRGGKPATNRLSYGAAFDRPLEPEGIFKAFKISRLPP